MVGRPKGLPKTGGRKKGIKNVKTRELEKAAADGITPLEYMLAVMRDRNAEPSRRDDMAKAVAPYLHARRAAEDRHGEPAPAVSISTDFDPNKLSIEQLRQLNDLLEKMAAKV